MVGGGPSSRRQKRPGSPFSDKAPDPVFEGSILTTSAPPSPETPPNTSTFWGEDFNRGIGGRGPQTSRPDQSPLPARLLLLAPAPSPPLGGFPAIPWLGFPIRSFVAVPGLCKYRGQCRPWLRPGDSLECIVPPHSMMLPLIFRDVRICHWTCVILFDPEPVIDTSPSNLGGKTLAIVKLTRAQTR